jgi:hypothetical protein
MKSKLILTYIDPELYKRLKRCQLEVGNFRHQKIVSKALSDWCDEVEKKYSGEQTRPTFSTPAG